MRRAWPVALILGLLLALEMGVEVARAQGQQSQTDQSKKTDKKKAKKKKDFSQSETDPEARDRRAIRELVQDFQDGFEGHTPTRVMSALDQRFYDFPRFEDAVTQFLEQNSQIRMYLRNASTEIKGDKATLIVDGEMAFSTKAQPSQEQMRRQRIQFFFDRTDKGWKIYDINPRNFFTF